MANKIFNIVMSRCIQFNELQLLRIYNHMTSFLQSNQLTVFFKQDINNISSVKKQHETDADYPANSVKM